MIFTESLSSTQNFKKVYKYGKSKANRLLIMYIRPNDMEKNRLGISVSKKVGNSVVRHRVTRLIRESYRLHEEMLSNGLDIAVIARENARDATYYEVESALLHLADLHHMRLKKKESN